VVAALGWPSIKPEFALRTLVQPKEPVRKSDAPNFAARYRQRIVTARVVNVC
jgi:hypothetical protein